MRILHLIIIITLFTSCTQTAKQKFVLPNWEKGDYSFVKKTASSFIRINTDTIVNITLDNSYKLSIIDKTKDYYIIEVQNQSNSDFLINTDIDSLTDHINTIENLIQRFPNLSLPYNVKVSSVGEIQEILDWETILNNFLIRTFEIYDSIGLQPEEHEFIEHYFTSNEGIEESLQNALYNEVSSNFELYNTLIPTDSVITEHIQTPNPNTGMLIDAKVEYRTLSIQNEIYEIEMKVIFEDDAFIDSDQFIENFFQKEEMEPKTAPTIDNYSIYYWNSNTSWIDSSNVYVNFHTDTFEIVMKTKTFMYK